MNIEIRNILLRNQYSFHPVVAFDPKKEKLSTLEFTSNNTSLTADIIEDTVLFSDYITGTLKKAHSKFGIGGYAEHRTVYSRSGVFDADSSEGEPRRLHLGIDIWGPAGTPIYAPMGGMVHSFAFNDHYGDYGATIILLHQLDGFPFYTLFGHLALKDLEKLKEGQYIIRGQEMAHFGNSNENGHWPPHLHFQVILDLGVYRGDYPGVCRYSERDFYLNNCPDPDLILQMNKLIS